MARCVLYSKRACSPCEEARLIVEAIALRAGLEFEEADVEQAPEAVRWLTVPVVVIDGVVVQSGRIDGPSLVAAIAKRGEGAAPEEPPLPREDHGRSVHHDASS